MEFPIIKNIQAKTIAGDIISVKPKMDSPKHVEEYINIWGHKVVVQEGTKFHYGSTPNIPGTWGHAFLHGFFIVDENGEHIYAGNEKYSELHNKFKFRNIMLKEVMDLFVKEKIYIGPNDSIAIDDREIIPDLFWGHPNSEEEMLEIKNNIINKLNVYFDK